MSHRSLLTAISSLIFCGIGAFGIFLCWVGFKQLSPTFHSSDFVLIGFTGVASAYSFYYGVKQWMKREEE